MLMSTGSSSSHGKDLAKNLEIKTLSFFWRIKPQNGWFCVSVTDMGMYGLDGSIKMSQVEEPWKRVERR